MNNRVLVTGAAGRLGSAVVRTLHEAGREVVAVDLAYNRDLPVRAHVLDLLDGLPLYELTEGCGAVVHLANHPNPVYGPAPQKMYSENVTMDMNVFQAAYDTGVRQLVFASSVQAIAGTRSEAKDLEKPSCLPYLPLDGNVPAHPGNAYALSKAAGEQMLRYFAGLDEKFSCTAIRFPLLLRMEWLDYYRSRGRSRLRHMGNLDEAFAYLAMPDAARLVLSVLEHPEPGYRQFFPAAPENYLGLPACEVIEEFYPDVPLRVPVEQMDSLVDICEVTEAVGWEPELTGLLDGKKAAAQDR